MIRIDMEMPNNCHDCRFKATDLEDCYYECIAITIENILANYGLIPDFCPLIEVEE